MNVFMKIARNYARKNAASREEQGNKIWKIIIRKNKEQEQVSKQQGTTSAYQGKLAKKSSEKMPESTQKHQQGNR